MRSELNETACLNKDTNQNCRITLSYKSMRHVHERLGNECMHHMAEMVTI